MARPHLCALRGATIRGVHHNDLRGVHHNDLRGVHQNDLRGVHQNDLRDVRLGIPLCVLRDDFAFYLKNLRSHTSILHHLQHMCFVAYFLRNSYKSLRGVVRVARRVYGEHRHSKILHNRWDDMHRRFRLGFDKLRRRR